MLSKRSYHLILWDYCYKLDELFLLKNAGLHHHASSVRSMRLSFFLERLGFLVMNEALSLLFLGIGSTECKCNKKHLLV